MHRGEPKAVQFDSVGKSDSVIDTTTGGTTPQRLPMLAFAALWLRYRETDARLLSGRFWDVMLWVSFLSFVGIGLYLAITKLGKLFG